MCEQSHDAASEGGEFYKEWKISRKHGLPKPLYSLSSIFWKIFWLCYPESGILIPGDQDQTCTLCSGSAVLPTGLPRSLLSPLFLRKFPVCSLSWDMILFSLPMLHLLFIMKLTFQNLSWKGKESSNCNTESMACKQPLCLPWHVHSCFRKAILFIPCLHISGLAGWGVSLLLRVL